MRASARARPATSARSSAGVTLCTSTTLYDGLDQPFAVSDPNGQVSTATFDALGRTTSTTSPRGGGALKQSLDVTTSRVTYDADGNVLDACRPRQASDGGGGCDATSRYATHTAYDVAGRPVASISYRDTSGSGASTLTRRWTYDADGNPSAVTDPNGHTTSSTYDLLDRQTAQTRPRTDASGTTAATAFTTRMVYDRVGNRISVSLPTTGTLFRYQIYRYDADNRLVDSIDGATGDTDRPASADGGADSRTRRLYDADGHPVATLRPPGVHHAASPTPTSAS